MDIGSHRNWLLPAMAAGVITLVLAQDPSASLKQADAAYKSGVEALSAGDLNTARDDFARVVHLAPQAEQGHSALGAVLVKIGEMTAGIHELEKALTMKPSDGSAQLNLALAYQQTGMPAKAIPFFAKVESADHAAGHATPPYVLAAYARALAESHPDLAIKRMHAAVSAESANAAWHDELGSLYAKQQEWGLAESQFREALAINRNMAFAHLHLGIALQQDHHPGAIDEIAQAAQLAPDDRNIQYEYAVTLANAGNDQEAIKLFQRLAIASPSSKDIAYQLALALQRTGDAKSALPLFEKVVAAQPENAGALTNFGMELTQAQRAQDAVPYLQQAVKLAPAMVTAHQNLAAAYIQLNQLDDAIAQLQSALALAPEAPQLHYNLGLAYKMKDDSASAIPQLITAETLNPSGFEPPYVLGVLYIQLARYDEAAQALERSLKLQPDNGDAWATLGSVYAKLDKLSEATNALQKAIKQLPRQPDPHLTLATIFAKEGKTADAIAERRQAGELMRANMNRQRAEVSVNSGDNLLKAGKVAEAIAQFEEAISFDAAYSKAHSSLANAMEQKGDAAGAIAERQKAESLANGPEKQ